MEAKKISVIVPVYNVDSSLRKCVSSIIRQDYSNLEIILIDDGSTDESGLICDSLAEQDIRIKVIHKKNGGLSSARNDGLKIATGEYIQFIDSDDWIQEEMLTNLCDTLDNTDADLAVCGIIITDGINNEPLQWFEENQVFTTQDALDQLIYNKKLTSHAWNKLYKYEVIKDVPFPEGKLYEDIRMMHFVFEKCRKVAVVKERYYYYYQRSNSITMLPKLKNKIAFVEAFEVRYMALKDKYPQYRETLLIQIAMSFALTIVQNQYNQTEYYENQEDILRMFEFIKQAEVKVAVKSKCSLKDRIIFYMALLFKTNANKIYRIKR